MIDALTELLPVLVALYLLDCVERVGPGKWLYVKGPLGRFRRVAAGFRLVGTTPVSRVYATSPRIFGPTTEGVFVFVGNRALDGVELYQRDRYAFLTYDEVARVTSEDECIRFPGARVSVAPAPAGSANRARVAADRLRELAAMSAEERSAALRAEDDSATDPEHVRRTVETTEHTVRWAEAGALVLFCVLFVVLPTALALSSQTTPVRFSVLVGEIVLLWIGTAIASVFARRRLGRLGFSVPNGAVLNLFLVPPAAGRAAVVLGRDVLAGFAAEAVAAALLDRSEALALLRREHAGIELARGDRSQPAWSELWTLRRRALDRIVASLDASPGDLRVAPPTKDPAARFCPFCAGWYTEEIVTCPDCTIELLPAAEG